METLAQKKEFKELLILEYWKSQESGRSVCLAAKEDAPDVGLIAFDVPDPFKSGQLPEFSRVISITAFQSENFSHHQARKPISSSSIALELLRQNVHAAAVS